MKKLLILLLLVVSTSIVWAYDFKVNGICYNILTGQANAVEVTNEYGNSSTEINYSGLINANIPATVTNQSTIYNVTKIREAAFRGSSSLVSVTIPNSVTTIGDDAFYNCSGLTSVAIGNSVTSIGESAFTNCTSLPSIIIPNSVTNISAFAFSGCSNLASITIGNSVTSIGVYVFSGCTSLTSMTVAAKNTVYDSRDNCNAIIETATNTLIAGCQSTIIPNSVIIIGTRAFYKCSGLTSITIPNSVTIIDTSAFSQCNSLTSITIPNSVTTIGEDVFYKCSSLTSISIPNSVTSIGEGAFASCSGLTSITIPNSVTTIGRRVFQYCRALTSVTIPNSVTIIGEGAFYYCDALTSITCEAVTPPSLGDDAFAFVNTYTPLFVPGTSIALYKATYQWEDFTNIQAIIPTEPFQVDGIWYYVLPNQTSAVAVVSDSYNESNYAGLTIANIPDSVTYQGTTFSVTSIEYEAFKDCISLTSVTIGNNVTRIEDGTFSGCSSLASVTLPNSVTSIGNSVFTGCNSLTAVTIPNSVTSIGDWIFWDCSSLTSVTIPNSVTSMGYAPFNGCINLTSMTVEIGNTVYDSRGNCNAIIETATNTLIAGCQNTIIPNTVTSIGDYAFGGCSRMSSVTIPNSVTSIGFLAFLNCSSLSSITIPNSVTSIGNSAFEGCSNFKSITIPYSVTSIGEWAFNGCINITSMVVAAKNTVYDSRDNCNAIIETASNTLITGCQNTIIPNSVTIIGESAFINCVNLTSIDIPNSVTRIGNSAFMACSNLTSISIPNGVTRLGETALALCSKLSSITCEAATPPSLGDNVFDLVNTSIPLYVPVNSIAYYQIANQWKDFNNMRAMPEKIIIDSAICESDLPITWQDKNIPYAGTYRDTIQTVEGYDSVIQILNLTLYPSYLIEEIVTIREDEMPYTWQNRTLTEAGNYSASYETVHGCDSTITLQLMVTALPIYTVNVVADHGHVNGTGTYPEGTQIYLTAVPDEGFEFQMWSDGSTTNPKSFTVMQDTTFRAHFFMPEVEQEVTVDSVGTNSVTITWDTVPGATLYELRIYKNGQLVVTYEIDANNNILNEFFNGPDRIVARKDSTGGSSETLQVNVSGLEAGQDYTYTLDALDGDLSFVGAQSGSFTTEDEPIDGLDNPYDDRRNAPRKVLRDGVIYIEMPDGTRYTPIGQEVERTTTKNENNQ